jgi:uncharacterized protein (DUF4415 family)
MKRTKTVKTFEAGRGYSRADWDEVSDSPEWTAEDFARAKPFAGALPELAATIRRGRGRPPVEAPKQAVTLRLDPATLEKFKATGKDWRTKMARTLDKAKV